MKLQIVPQGISIDKRNVQLNGPDGPQVDEEGNPKQVMATFITYFGDNGLITAEFGPFVDEDWVKYVEMVNDPEATAKKAQEEFEAEQARRKILAPPVGVGPSRAERRGH